MNYKKKEQPKKVESNVLALMLNDYLLKNIDGAFNYLEIFFALGLSMSD